MTAVNSATNHWLLVYTLLEAAAALLQVLVGFTGSHSYGVLLHRLVQGTPTTFAYGQTFNMLLRSVAGS